MTVRPFAVLALAVALPVSSPLAAAPDAVVDALGADPANPSPGSPARVFAVVRNAGSDPLAAASLRVDFFLDGRWIASGTAPRDLPPGASASIAADGLLSATTGPHLLRAAAVVPPGTAEADGTNNDAVVPFDVSADGSAAAGLAKPTPADAGLRWAACQPIGGASYQAGGINGSPGTPPAAQNPDVNIKLRGSAPTGGVKDLVDISGPTDSRAPKLYGLFSPDRVPAITALYAVGKAGGIGQGTEADPPHLAGFQTQSGEILETPPSGYDLGGGYTALVIYADDNSITIKYTRDDNIVSGYAVHILGICVEPSLLSLYQQNAGGTQRPQLRGGQAIGRAQGTEIWVSVRDTGQFMDPRSRKDWWAGGPANNAPPATVTPQPPPGGTGSSSGKPDVVVDSISLSPSSPSPGQSVSFSCVIHNVGNAATPAGVQIGGGYKIDGTQVTWGIVDGPLAAGATVTIGTNGGNWTATSGSHTLMAVADDVNRFAESDENNNTRSKSFTVGGGGGTTGGSTTGGSTTGGTTTGGTTTGGTTGGSTGGSTGGTDGGAARGDGGGGAGCWAARPASPAGTLQIAAALLLAAAAAMRRLR